MYQFRSRQANGPIGNAFVILGLIYHSIVKDVRKSHKSPLMSLLMEMLQAVVFTMAFLLMFQFLGMRGAKLRGDFVLYIMSGIFLFMTHTKALGAVFAAEGPTSPMMQHAPMNTVIAITSAALSSLYTQTLSMMAILFCYYVFFTPFEIYEPVNAFAMFLLAWLSGCAIGMVLYSIKPWAPAIVGIISMVIQRANMIASGKMFVANMLPPSMLLMFDWNPLFHCIDQARGFTFINYNPHNSDLYYPLWVTLALLMIGLVGEYYTRKRASSSWAI